jgi:hypothetical protein
MGLASVGAQLQAVEEAGKVHRRELMEIHEALGKLGTNQQTLGDNLRSWRHESGGDVGIISNRLQQLETTAVELLTRVGDQVLELARDPRGEGGRRGHGLKRWLHGTGAALALRGRHAFSAPRRDAAPARPEKKS